MSNFTKTLGESTRRRVGGDGGGGGGMYMGTGYGGYGGDGGIGGGSRRPAVSGYGGGGGAGTWGKAATGRAPVGGGAEAPMPGRTGTRPASARPKAKPNAAGVKSAWDEAPRYENIGGATRAKGATGAKRGQTARPASARDAGGRMAQTSGGNGSRAHLAGTGLATTQPRAGAPPGQAAPPYWSENLHGPAASPASPTRPSHRAKAGFSGRPASARPASRSGLAPGAGSSGEGLRASGGSAGGGRDALYSSAEGSIGGSAEMVTGAHLVELEEELRDRLRELRTLYETERQLLLRVFREVDDGSGDVDIHEFCDLWERLGVEVSTAEAKAIFRKSGFTSVMPYERFAHNLLTAPARALATDAPVRKGAFVEGQRADFFGKIIYPQCRKGVYPPSDWDPALAVRSAAVPDASLRLAFVYGYGGLANGAPNLFYNSNGEMVYYTAGVGVTYNSRTHSQRFFLGHDNDIRCLHVCPHPITVNRTDYPANTLVATGQMCTPDTNPYVSIWDSRVGSQTGRPEVCRLEIDRALRATIACAFSPRGDKLAIVGSDNQHTVQIWDWAKKKKIGEGKGAQGDPPQVYGVVWNSGSEREEFVTYGAKHIKMWSMNDDNQWVSVSLLFGKMPMQDVVSACFLPPKPGGGSTLLTGHPSGEIYVWQNGAKCVRRIQAHDKGPVVVKHDGGQTYGGVRCLRLKPDMATLISAGADGTMQFWDVSDGTIQDGRLRGPPVKIQTPYKGEAAPGLRAVDCAIVAGRECIAIGTNRCDVWEYEAGEEWPECRVYGHTADLYHVAWHPLKPHIFASACESARIFLWDAVARQVIRTCSVGFQCRSICFSDVALADDVHHIAVGGKSGKLIVLREDTLQPLFKTKDCTQAIDAVKYSPDGRTLAAASHDTYIDLYNSRKGYQHVGRCEGHSSTVTHIDWSVDSSILQSCDQAYELLYWDYRTGKQITANQRNTKWASYTLVLGFGVMGVWPDFSDGTDINSCHRSNTGRHVITADDYGTVKLFNYPCVVEDARYRAYPGHSSHVMGCRFSPDDKWVITAGGKDRAMFQFMTHAIADLLPGEMPQKEATCTVVPCAWCGVEEPPPEPEPYWGALDASGKNFGWVKPGVQGEYQPPSRGSPSRSSGGQAPPPHGGGGGGGYAMSSVSSVPGGGDGYVPGGAPQPYPGAGGGGAYGQPGRGAGYGVEDATEDFTRKAHVGAHVGWADQAGDAGGYHPAGGVSAVEAPPPPLPEQAAVPPPAPAPAPAPALAPLPPPGVRLPPAPLPTSMPPPPPPPGPAPAAAATPAAPAPAPAPAAPAPPPPPAVAAAMPSADPAPPPSRPGTARGAPPPPLGSGPAPAPAPAPADEPLARPTTSAGRPTTSAGRSTPPPPLGASTPTSGSKPPLPPNHKPDPYAGSDNPLAGFSDSVDPDEIEEDDGIIDEIPPSRVMASGAQVLSFGDDDDEIGELDIPDDMPLDDSDEYY